MQQLVTNNYAKFDVMLFSGDSMNTILSLMGKRSSLLFILLLLLAGCRDNSGDNVRDIINTTGAKYVPDHRLGVWRIITEFDGKNTLILKGETTSIEAKDDLIKTLGSSGMVLTDSIITLPDTSKVNHHRGVVTLSVINLRRVPEHSAELVSQAIMGTPVMVLKDEDSWLMIRTPDNYISWTEKSSVALLSDSEFDSWKHAERIMYTENTGWIFGRAGGADVVGDIVAGAILEKIGEASGNVIVKLPDGREGSVKKDKTIDFELFCNNISDDPDNVIKIASTLIGIPYLWGGTSPKGADCSGFTQSVYFRNGLILQRDASLQVLHGKSVEISEGTDQLLKGDLLFFGSKDENRVHVTHVAIYTGNNEYINSSGRVIINSLDSTKANYSYYRKNGFLAARRVLGVENDPGIITVNKHPWYR